VSGFLLDSNVISELVRPRPDPGVLKWVESTDESLLQISVLTLGEIRKGIALLADGRRRISLEGWLAHDLAVRFSGRILPIDVPIANRWGRISAAAKASGSALPVIDGLLAATAMQHNLTMVSRDEAYLQIAGVELFNPWLP
jgi:predicted nucleic acid-binding protein